MLEIVNTFKIATEEEKENFKNRASDALKVADTPNAFLGWLCLTLKMEKFSDMDAAEISLWDRNFSSFFHLITV